MQKRWIWTLLLCVTLVISAGFGASAKKPVRLVTYGTANTQANFTQLAELFNATNSEYELEFEVYPSAEYPTKMTVMLATGVYPDIFLTWAQYKPSWADQGLLLDVSEMWNKSAIARSNRLYPFALDAAMYKGKIFGVPYDFSAMLWAINVDALNNTGLAIPPNNWDVNMMQQYAQKLNKPEQGMYGIKQGALAGTTNWQWTSNYVGEGWVSPDLKRVNVENPKNIEMLQMWQDLLFRYEVAWVAGKPRVADEWQGGYAMWTTWGHYASRLEDSPFDYTMIPYPKGPAGQNSFAHGHLWTIPAGIRDPKPGWAVMEWLLSPEGQRANVELLGKQPLSANNDLWNRYYAPLSAQTRPRVQKALIDTVYGQGLAQTMNYWTSWPEVERIMNSHLANVLSRNASPANEMAIAAQKIKAIMELN